MSKEDLDHVLRPDLPWRKTEMTECGRIPSHPTSSFRVLTREEAKKKFKEQGQTRSALTTCMTCFQTMQRWPSWEEDPVKCLGREMHGSKIFGDQPQFRNELQAIALLIDAHRDEFEDALEDLEEVTGIDELRKARRLRTLSRRR